MKICQIRANIILAAVISNVEKINDFSMKASEHCLLLCPFLKGGGERGGRLEGQTMLFIAKCLFFFM